jgi:hypothetical protein
MKRLAPAVLLMGVVSSVTQSSSPKPTGPVPGLRRPYRYGYSTGPYTKAPEFTSVVRFVELRRGAAWGKPVMYVVVRPYDKPKPLSRLVVPKEDPDSREYDPDPKYREVAEKLIKGNLIQVTWAKVARHCVICKLAKYEPKPGEDDPMGFLFVRSSVIRIGRAPYLSVTLEKFGKQAAVYVPNRKGDDGKPEPDPALLDKVAKLKKGQVVEVETEGRGKARFLRYIEPYRAPVEGEFLRIVERPASRAKRAGVEIRADGQAKIVYFRSVGRGEYAQPDPKLLAAAKRLLRGDKIRVKTIKEGDEVVAVRIDGPEPPATP